MNLLQLNGMPLAVIDEESATVLRKLASRGPGFSPSRINAEMVPGKETHHHSIFSERVQVKVENKVTVVIALQFDLVDEFVKERG